ncbi:MAG: ABC transporter ATP-binding protein [Ruminococcus flavefaciens]|nr:ABC transporter ATP-binding protein [Ruminococcus flavefaciens]MCM1229212.1 ABC transporter ATP-binding protein [Ruminococcus flavefaciens]
MNAIEVKNLTKKYKGFALENLNLTLPGGCVMGLIGENGAGKSTAIKSILGIIRPDSGSVELLGKSPSADIRNDIGVVLDEVGMPQEFNIREIGAVMKNSFTNWDDGLFRDYMAKFRLPDKKPFKSFSKGMKMKLGIAVALSHNARLLILDEPTSGLDPVVRDEIVDIFNDFTRDENHSILISSHIVSDLEKICDYIAFLHNGRLMLCEEKDRLLEQYCFINTTADMLGELDKSAVIGRKVTKWGVEAIVDRNKIPHSFETLPITIEDLFIFMVKEEK